MKGLNKEFMADPPAFMRKYAMDTVNPALGQGGVGENRPLPSGVYQFDLSLMKEDQGRVIVGLFSDRPKGDSKHAHPIEAHWLPWKSGDTTETTLDNKAKFFFTAPLGGCRIQIAGTKVLHIAGDTKLITEDMVTPRGKAFQKTSIKALDKNDPDQAAGVAFRTAEANKHAGEQFDPARKFSSTDYGHSGLGFLAGYATHGVWLFVGQTLQIDGKALQVRSCKELVGGEFAA